jgi:hypothetical protein
VGFRLGEGLPDGVQIGRVWRQTEEPAAVVAQGLCGFPVSMGREIVEDDDGAWRDLWNGHFADAGCECGAIHCALDDPWRDQGVPCQARDQGLGSPASEWRIPCQARTAPGPATQACEVRLHRRFINENSTIRQCGTGWPPMSEPIGALLPYLGPAALGGGQRLFLQVNPSRDRRLAIGEWCTRTPAWCSFRMPMICASLKRLLFIVCLLSWRTG